ncbi:Methyltransferase domain-containing protein [Fodinibius roseus]|uniref:Methyltransferase domain-containing protein n=1 Tax=Fodinibius roseus TaxID=1194090 RepID=A0A1M4XMA1_9BACT|nr:class I SAM-dependent methyltransferase [Fodinibius roseus]SHE94551.1 Methyltransferase domain-containing protein [Fodinibius roseus]
MNKASQPKRDNKPHTGKSLGPVNNLEHHLHPEWWKRIFNSIYLKTDADVVGDDKITESEVTIFHELLEVKNGHSLLDLACGQGRHLIELAKRGDYNLFGLDRSRYLLQRAKSNAKKRGAAVNLKEGDARKLPYAADSFDFVTILGNSFGYFEVPEEDAKILKEVFRVLKPGGKLLMDIADGSFLRKNFIPRSWEWIDKKHFVCRERSLAADNRRLISREVVTHTDTGVIVDQFYAERLYTEEELEMLVDKVGFREIQLHGNIKVDSVRNQDLGMMANRFILTAGPLRNGPLKKVRKTSAMWLWLWEIPI